jgi:single stranded DNA-binding protein
MALLNLSIITGNVVDAPKTETHGETIVTKFAIAHNHSKDKPADFFDCVAFGQSDADYLAKNATKGRQVTIQGRLKQDKWTAEDGQNRSRVTIIVDETQPGRPKADTELASEEA